MDIRTRLRVWRTATNRTQWALAKEAGCDHTTISRIESGMLEPTPSVAAKIEELTKGHELGQIMATEWARQPT